MTQDKPRDLEELDVPARRFVRRLCAYGGLAMIVIVLYRWYMS